MASAESIEVEVVAATPERQELVAVTLPGGASAEDAIDQSGLLESFPGLDRAGCGLAIWGQPVEPGRVLRQGDRVEILRPLAFDPRDARRELAKEGQHMGGVRPDEG